MEQLSIRPVDLIGIIALFVALLYTIQLLIVKDRDFIYNRFLIAFFASLTFIIAFFEIYDYGYLEFASNFIPILNIVVLGLAPTLWLYIHSLVRPKETKNLLKHYIYAIVVGILGVLLFLFLKFIFIENQMILYVFMYLTIGTLCIIYPIQNAYYIYQSFRLYGQHQKNIANVFSYDTYVDLKWIRILITGYLVFFVLMLVTNLLDNMASDVLFDTTMLMYVIYTGFHAIRQDDVYKNLPIEEEEKEESRSVENSDQKSIETVTNTNKEEKTGISVSRPDLKDEILSYIKEEKPYLNQDLNIYSLASMLKTNSKYLSQTINNDIGRSFVSFINSYRIEEAKKLLARPESNLLTIEAIGNKSGFKSKSAFNNAFKKEVGQTPSAYKKSIIH